MGAGPTSEPLSGGLGAASIGLPVVAHAGANARIQKAMLIRVRDGGNCKLITLPVMIAFSNVPEIQYCPGSK
ncbi:MAG: hypothetical protein AAB425_14075, partial [Bdellovibrionota bacterium]